MRKLTGSNRVIGAHSCSLRSDSAPVRNGVINDDSFDESKLCWCPDSFEIACSYKAKP